MNRLPSFPTRRVADGGGPRAALVAAGVVLIGACSEGYPGKEAAVTNPADMTQAQRMAAINLLSQGAHPEYRWRYSLQPHCVLEITVTRRGEGPRLSSAPLQEANVKTSFDKGTRLYDVQVVPPSQSGDAISVLMTSRWKDSVEMRSLLQFIQSSCARAAPLSFTGARSR